MNLPMVKIITAFWITLNMARPSYSSKADARKGEVKKKMIGPITCIPSDRGGWDCSGHLDSVDYDEDLSSIPSIIRTVGPSGSPFSHPSESPSESPSQIPSQIPSQNPSQLPSFEPSTKPSSRPSLYPSHLPTVVPSEEPSSEPSTPPSTVPSGSPTRLPSGNPTSLPSDSPTFVPSDYPSGRPASLPSKSPSLYPSSAPSILPTSLPSMIPSTYPSSYPSIKSSTQPSIQFTDFPSSVTSDNPIEQLSNSPTSHPSINSSNYPTFMRSQNPTTQISYSPSCQPSQKFTTEPSSTNSPTKESKHCEFATNTVVDCINSLSYSTPADERSLFIGEFICSPNENFLFGMTLDGYLAICENENRVWEKGPFLGEDPFAQFQLAGNFVVYNARPSSSAFKSLWHSGTNGNLRSTLILDNNGRVMIIDDNGDIIWRIKPSGPSPTLSPTISHLPTLAPSISFNPTVSRMPIGSATYFPGNLFYDSRSGLYLSLGLNARRIARTNRKVLYSNETTSEDDFLDQPDAATCIPSSDGGWHYLINSEKETTGGVGRITFNSLGEVIGYDKVLTGTRMNCGGGTTPWNTFVSCEEFQGTSSKPSGQCWEVHPEGDWSARATSMGGIEGGKFESVAFDERDMNKLKAFVTHDSRTGEVRRFTPDENTLMEAIQTNDYSNVLHIPGRIDYLEIFPSKNTFRWTEDKNVGKENAENYFPNTEGIDAHDGFLYFVSKKRKEMFILDLDSNTYTVTSTKSGAFNGQPDQIVRLLPHDANENDHGLLYFLEDGGSHPAGVFARDKNADKAYTIIEGGPNRSDETTGLAFCDGGKRMMVAFQDEGVVYEIVRDDGFPFYGKTVNIKYHGDSL